MHRMNECGVEKNMMQCTEFNASYTMNRMQFN